MKIIVTIINQETTQKFDIQIDNRQKISTTLSVLKENLYDFSVDTEGEIIIWSERNKCIVDRSKTYEESSIYSGDKLVVKVKTKM